SALVSVIPQHKALERIGMPAAIYDADGDIMVGPEDFPQRAIGTPNGSTWTAVSPGGDLYLFHPVELDSKKRTICLGLNARRLNRLIPGTSKLTQAEFSVLAGVINGRSVRSIAEAEGVSYNTRRRQIEAALEKLNVHSQSEAVRLTFVAVIDRLLAALSVMETEAPGIETLARYYRDEVRFHWIHLSGNPPFRVAEYGDPAGRPVLLHHWMVSPCGVAPSTVDSLRAAGFRVIVPLRPGFFDAPAWRGRSAPEALLEAWSKQCDSLLSFLNLESVHVATMIFPASWAVDFARRFPHRCASLIFLSAPQPSTLWRSEARTASFIHSIAGMVEKAPWLAEPMTRLHAFRIRDHRSSRKLFQKSFSNSPEDLAEIELLAMEPHDLEVVPTTLKESIAGVVADLRVLLDPWETYLAGLDMPLHFVHGAGDGMSPASVMERLVQSLPHATIHIQKGKGNLFVLRELADALTIATAT
ncbi:MAG: hypothetical protein KDI01_01275, partial [Halioglobus sp.]|nr:hypothetical protein [Halioglobus sp.]